MGIVGLSNAHAARPRRHRAGYALAVAHGVGIVAHLGDCYPEETGFIKETAEPTASAASENGDVRSMWQH